jgi:hypothetical protein
MEQANPVAKPKPCSMCRFGAGVLFQGQATAQLIVTNEKLLFQLPIGPLETA